MIGDNHRGNYIVTCLTDIGKIKFHQKLTCFYLLPVFNLGLKELAFQLHGIQANMHQNFRAVVADHGNGMLGIEDGIHSAVGRGIEFANLGNNRHAVTQHLAGEHFVGDLGDVHQLAGQRCVNTAVALHLGFGSFRFRLILVQDQSDDKGQNHRQNQADAGIDEVHAVVGVDVHGHGGDAGAHSGEGLDLGQADKQAAQEAGSHNTHHNLLVLQGNTVQSRLGDAEQAGDTGGNRGGAQVLILGLQGHCQAGAAFGDVMRQRGGQIQHIKAGACNGGNRVRNQGLVHAQRNHEGQDGGNQSNSSPTQGIVQSQNCSGQQGADVIAQRSQHQQGYREGRFS